MGQVLNCNEWLEFKKIKLPQFITHDNKESAMRYKDSVFFFVGSEVKVIQSNEQSQINCFDDDDIHVVLNSGVICEINFLKHAKIEKFVRTSSNK